MLWSRPLLRRAGWRHLLHRPWQTALTVLGVALAVAVVVGIDLANTSAERAFHTSLDQVAGRATHEIVGAAQGIDEGIYSRLRRSGAAGSRDSVPVIEGDVRHGSRPLRLLGIDPLAGDGSAIPGRTDHPAAATLPTVLIAEPRSVALSRELAESLGVNAGDRLAIEVPHRDPAGPRWQSFELTVAVVFVPPDERSRRATADGLITDIATAQKGLGRLGRLDRIDLHLAPDVSRSHLAALRAQLPAGTVLRAKANRADALNQMTRAFRLNLEALSMLALVVGVFLVYNTLSFSVVQRRPSIGRLRALGVTRREIFALVLWEAAAIGLVGTALGLVFGIGLAQGLVALVVRTINDLYFQLQVTGAPVAWGSIAKGIALGVGGPLLASLGPAREATSALPRLALQRSALESRSFRAAPRLAIVGSIVLVIAAGLLAWPSRDVLIAFAGVFAVVAGFACWVPLAIVVASRLTSPIAGRLFGGLGRFAARGVEATLSRTAVAASALVIAVATTLGMAIMVTSFRATLIDWLDATLQADLYVTAIDLEADSSRGPTKILAPAWIEALSSAPGIDQITTTRRVRVRDRQLGDVALHAVDMSRQAFDRYRFAAAEGDHDALFGRWARGDGVLISEPLAFHHQLRPGDTLGLEGSVGTANPEVLGVFYDYASDRGLVVAHRALYDRFWNDPAVHSLGLSLAAGMDPDTTAARLLERVPSGSVRIAPNREIKRLSLAIFDRTFQITGVLRLLAITVAFLGILSALMALQLERAREMAVLRATGLVPAQVWALVTAQTGLLGLFSGLLAVPLGGLLATLLIQVINKRSFGWTLHMEIPPAAIGQTILLAVVAALIAGLWPAHRMAKTPPATALRDE